MKIHFSKPTSNGFTIRELLSALAIMALSLGLVIPVLAVRNDFQAEGDRSNAQQIAALFDQAQARGAQVFVNGNVHSTIASLVLGVSSPAVNGATSKFKLSGFAPDALVRAERFLTVSNGVLVYRADSLK